jgi:hypothetical protein
LRPLDKVLESLSTSAFRRGFVLGAKEKDYLRRKGMPVILDHARDFVARRLAPAEPVNDGKQTPFRGHPVFVAQHATATCCRSCLAKWHDIPAGRELTAREQTHVVASIQRWLETQ